MKQLAILVGFALLCLVAVPTLSVWAASAASQQLESESNPESSVLVDGTTSAKGRIASLQSADPMHIETPSRSIRDWYLMGGPAMNALALCSILIFAVVLERCYSLRRSAFLPPKLVEALHQAIEGGNRNDIKSLCEEGSSALSRLTGIAIEGFSSRDRLDAEGSAVVHQAQRNLPLLAALGNLATMLGLLGTVLGMIQAFEVIAQAGSGDARIVAGGIFRALVTTAAGLTIAIFALAAHAIFNRRATDFVVDLESLVTEVAEQTDRPNRSLDVPESSELL